MRWLRPLGAAGNGPAYRVTDPTNRDWDLWFEAAGMWRYYGVTSPYRAVRKVLPGAPQPLGADLVLIRPGSAALIIECKYSLDPSYVGRNGYEQTLAYMTEARSGLAIRVSGAVIGPDDIVMGTASIDTSAGTLTIASPSTIGTVVHDFLAPGTAG